MENSMKKRCVKKWLTQAEAMEVFKKYDQNAYNFYHNNAWMYGITAEMYAESLLEKHEKK